MIEGKIVRVSGPLVVAEGMLSTRMYDVVHVSEKRLMGEIIELKEDLASIQVYEDTEGVGPGEPVYATGIPLSVELGPGLIESIYDGTQRPLNIIREKAGDNITRGISIPGLDRKKKWRFKPTKKKGDAVVSGDIIGTVKETSLVTIKIMVPPETGGTIEKINDGDFTVEETIAVIKDGNEKKEIKLLQVWPVRIPRPFKKKLSPLEALVTGQRVLDTFFPIGKGGTACVPGPFGSGKTIIQHQLAKWVDAEIIVYIGCGERGNEMTDVLLEFPELKDPRSDEPLMKRTVLIANTSNMPVAAREASVYTGITIAEYFRDMGMSVAVMADSTSRWAEAMREISGRLEEMPGEEGYPAYLGAKIASFYERAGRVICLGSDEREGMLSVIGAVSPPGGDLSDPVVQATLRVVKVFWSLEDKLAAMRHFPAISWLNSYSLYSDSLENYFKENVTADFVKNERTAMMLLQNEAELWEIVRLVGVDALSEKDQLILEVSRSIREDFLHQNAFHDVDTYTSLKKQYFLLKVILYFYERTKEALEEGIPISTIKSMKVKDRIARAKYIPENEIVKIEEIMKEIDEELVSISKEEIKMES
ncbi:V-type ATP synthase subunit A [candidate division WOR-3 bacterium]|nr:V-type ATP synthase subunit A [candidate division WOR-3 bacterium]